ncbi:MAG: hypothetical protein D6705_12245 [Deltaproteobacteria bacterium]|nr:MAG: hypothetical protein D6705_12245 [Deltaproteobacteria bacterium]
MKAPTIWVVPTSGDWFDVTIEDGRGSSRHRVRAPAGDVLRYGKGAAAGAVVDAAMRFLLDREPKESILSRFALSDIERYFPEFPAKVTDYLAQPTEP